MTALLSYFLITLTKVEFENVLVMSKILGLLVISMTADEKYSPGNSENLLQPIQMQISNDFFK